MDWRENLARSKEVLGAYARQGAKELGAALFPVGTAAQPSEYGMAFTKLPSHVAEDMRGDSMHGPSHTAEPSILDRYTTPEPEPDPGAERPDPMHEREGQAESRDPGLDR